MKFPGLCTTLFLVLFWTFGAGAAQSPELIPFWNTSDESNASSIDHSSWQELLNVYLDAEHASGIHRFNYAALKDSEDDQQSLRKYLMSLTSLDPRQYARQEQLAYWINLYNALTVYVVTGRYPVESIREIKSGLINFGPWDKELIIIQGQKLTLNNIEHGILRPIWRDPRLHFAINCASIGCPNLSPEVYRSDNLERLLEEGSSDYVNHPRGVSIEGDRLTVSSLFDWWKDDFGGTDEAVLEHLKKYAEPDLAEQLLKFTEFDDDYDWNLNEP